MSATACALLRHDVRPRWVGDLLAQWCHTCQPGHLYIPEPAPSGLGRNPPCDSARSSAHVPAPHAAPPPLAVT